MDLEQLYLKLLHSEKNKTYFYFLGTIDNYNYFLVCGKDNNRLFAKVAFLNTFYDMNYINYLIFEDGIGNVLENIEVSHPNDILHIIEKHISLFELILIKEI